MKGGGGVNKVLEPYRDAGGSLYSHIESNIIVKSHEQFYDEILKEIASRDWQKFKISHS